MDRQVLPMPEYAELVGHYLARKMPNLTSQDRSPLTRQAKIYIDALQNRKGQTMASIYSLRPRPGAPVSTPLRWSEIKSGLDRRNLISVASPRVSQN